MELQKRPGGLTALAVINFVLAGLVFFGVILLQTMRPLLDRLPAKGMSPAQQATFAAIQNMNLGMIVLTVCLGILSSLFLLIAGLGYLKQKRVMGRICGNCYFVIAVLRTLLALVIMPFVGAPTIFSTIIGLVYPVITLVLINGKFKENLVN
jgi:hypothetical protein